MADHRLLLLGGLTVAAYTDTGTGVESVTIYISIAETSAASEDWTLPSITISLTDSGGASEAITTIEGSFLTLFDVGYSSEAASIAFGGISISDSGVGDDVFSELSLGDHIEDSGAGLDDLNITYDFVLIDTALSSEYFEAAPVSGNLVIYDFSFAADFAFRLQGFVRLDDFDLPHVLTLQVNEQSEVDFKKIQGGSLPKRSITSKMGRVVEIEGWTSSQSDIDDLEAMKDGTVRVFLHPSGDSFAVLVSDVQVDNQADDYGRRSYTLTLKETREW